MKANPKLTGENLTKAAAKQPWDASVQALVAFPQALKLLDENIQWTTDLGNAFLDQQTDVMDAIQRMRKKAKDGGKLANHERTEDRSKNGRAEDGYRDPARQSPSDLCSELPTRPWYMAPRRCMPIRPLFTRRRPAMLRPLPRSASAWAW